MWNKIEIKTGAKTAEIWKTIQDSFETIFIAAGGPEDAAMYFNSRNSRQWRRGLGVPTRVQFWRTA